MRKQLLVFAFLFFPFAQAFCQAELAIDTVLYSNAGDTLIHNRDTLRMEYQVRNVGTQPYYDSIRTAIRINGVFVDNQHAFQGSFNVGETAMMFVELPVTPDLFTNFKNIVVVWPTGTGIKTVDTLTFPDVITQYSLGIKYAENGLKHVRFYPNPASDRLYVQPVNSANMISDLKITSIMGREVASYSGPVNQL
ncbi:MAG: T9SS type A sorting domain-containing protein, partial [Bacteroidota bacterium]|nr:T9SS type A sorting domain-containing protein [Bacteroidota bacterium]